VIPTYNKAPLLLHTVPSYMQPEVESIIFVDAASQDGTADAIRELQVIYGAPQTFQVGNSRGV
jgi:glycosyltransferase involved in cell wall biosynthesis